MRLPARITALALLLPLAACGVAEEGAKLAALPSMMEGAKNCMLVHSSLLHAGFGPLSVVEQTPETDEIIEALRGGADALPLDETGQPTLRNAAREIADMLDEVKGTNIETTTAMAKSEPYQRHTAVLGAWHEANCQSEEAPQGDEA